LLIQRLVSLSSTGKQALDGEMIYIALPKRTATLARLI
jgi:hypothetical protein